MAETGWLKSSQTGGLGRVPDLCLGYKITRCYALGLLSLGIHEVKSLCYTEPEPMDELTHAAPYSVHTRDGCARKPLTSEVLIRNGGRHVEVEILDIQSSCHAL